MGIFECHVWLLEFIMAMYWGILHFRDKFERTVLASGSFHSRQWHIPGRWDPCLHREMSHSFVDTGKLVLLLVGGWPTPLKNDGVKVSWDDFPFPTEWKKKIHVPKHQPGYFCILQRRHRGDQTSFRSPKSFMMIHGPIVAGECCEAVLCWRHWNIQAPNLNTKQIIKQITQLTNTAIDQT